MPSTLEQLTSLPNLHPALVHFPIALAPVAVLFDLAALLQPSRRSEWARGASALWVLAALGAWAAWWAGGRAADSVVGLSARAQARVGEHSDWGLWTLWAFVAIAVARVVLGHLRPSGKTLPALGAVLGLGACALVGTTADLGGGLVYQLGVAVERPESGGTATGVPKTSSSNPSAADTATAGMVDDPANRLETREDGTVVWSPAPGDATALGSILQPVSGDVGEAVRVGESEGSGSKGLTLEVSGRTLLTLPGDFRDVEVAAVVDVEEFSGTFGLAHHVRDAARAGLLTVGVTDGTFTLLTLDAESDPKILDEATSLLPEGPLELAVTAAGRHLRGTLAGKLVVHGHEPALPRGGAGILVDGEGSIRLESLVVTPIDD